MDLERQIEKYADLIVKCGLNIEPGQEVFLMAGFDQLEFVRKVTHKCYLAGASRVINRWIDMPTERLAWLYQSEELLSEVVPWELELWRHRADKLPAVLWLDSDDPDGMQGIDQSKRSRAQQARYPHIKPFREACENRHQWCIAAVPGVQWAKKIFPGVDEKEAVDRLWRAILSCSRADGSDPEAAWAEHNRVVHEHCRKLNELNFKSLHYYSAATGTDFTVGLMDRSIFCGGAEKDLSGRIFNPNIPSEEVFTTPCRGVAEGRLAATKPLSYQGVMIEDFVLHFAEGRVVKCEAAKGIEALQQMIAMDEGAPYLGEAALVGFDSPINRSGILFYNTLFDENAVCHFALGKGFNDCVRGFSEFTQQQLTAMGVNDSMIHVDFMIGSEDLEISGTTADGRTSEIFSKGVWAI
jgi:aminopeptidase